MHWLARIEDGPQRVNHAATAVGKLIYSFGGYDSSDHVSSDYIDIHVLDTDTLQWTPLHYNEENTDDIPLQRFGHTVVTYENKIYLFGGRNNTQTFRVLHCFDPDINQWSVPTVSGKIPYAVDGHSACVIGDCMYLFGGYEEIIREFNGEPHKINLKTFVWDELSIERAPESRDFHTATAVGDRMYIFGGRYYDLGINYFDTDNYDNRISYFDTSRMVWVWPKVEGTIPDGRRSHSAFSFGHEIFILCGYNPILGIHLNDMFKFNTETNTWSEVRCQGIGPSLRRRQCCVRIHQNVYVFGGTSPGHSYCSEADDIVEDGTLKDLSDLYVLNIFPSLYRCCLLQVITMTEIDERLPRFIKLDIFLMISKHNRNRRLFEEEMENCI